MATFRGVAFGGDSSVAYAYRTAGGIRVRVRERSNLAARCTGAARPLRMPAALVDAVWGSISASGPDAVAGILAMLAVSWAASHVPAPEWVSAWLPLAAAVAFLAATPMSRYHAAEHRTSNAEAASGGGAVSVADIMSATRFHTRCGSNLAGIVIVLLPIQSWAVVSLGMDGTVTSVVFLAAALAIMDAATDADGVPRGIIGRVVLAPGYAIQAVVTQPCTEDQAEVALAAREAIASGTTTG